MYKIEKENLEALFRKIAESQDLILPVKKAGQTNFGLWNEGEEADLATMLKTLTEEIIEDTMAEEVPKLLRDRQDSYFEDLDQDTIRLEYRELFLSTAWYLLLSRCGIDPGEYMYLEDFRSITDFNNEDVLLRLGSPISEHCASILKEISLYLFQKNLQKNRAPSGEHA